VGYASEAAFSQAFKREYGLSPSAWRQQQVASAEPAPGLAQSVTPSATPSTI
jgi:AraC-like DNA-binding protein